MSNINFETALIEDDKKGLHFVLTPLSCDKNDVYKYFIKYSEKISRDHYLVTIEPGENSDHIDYSRFMEYESSSSGKFFFINNIRFFMYYNVEYFNKSNVLIFLVSISDLEEIPFRYMLDNFDINFYYPKNLCLDINIDYKKTNTNIYKKQLELYKNEYLKFIKEKENIRDLSISKEFNKSTFDNPANYLNVYYDKIIPSLENISLESAIERAPKFKNIFVELIIKNKKRHLVHMIDNRYGMEAFEVIYNKIDNKVPLIAIKSTESLDSKNKKLQEFNKNNSPKILLTDYIFTGDMMPKNISVYHLTDGGGIENIYSIFEHIKTLNKDSSKDKVFTVISHIASTLKGELTIDNIKELSFSDLLNKYSFRYTELKKRSTKLFLEGTEIKITN